MQLRRARNHSNKLRVGSSRKVATIRKAAAASPTRSRVQRRRVKAYATIRSRIAFGVKQIERRKLASSRRSLRGQLSRGSGARTATARLCTCCARCTRVATGCTRFAATEAVTAIALVVIGLAAVIARGSCAGRSLGSFVSRLVDVLVSVAAVAARTLNTAVGAAQARRIA